MSMPSDKITVLLADDSSVIRSVISNILESEPGVEVVSSVSNGEYAITMAKAKKPDITILDVEMPVMDGLTALPEILKNSPDTKVIMCSSLTAEGADTTIKAMALGAADCLVKPTSAEARGPDSPFRKKLLQLVKSLGAKQPTAQSAPTTRAVPYTPGAAKPTPIAPSSAIKLKEDIGTYKGKPRILAIGSSTGGPKALFTVLSDLRPLDVPIVITQHMPATFTKILAEHITQQTGIEAHEGAEGMVVEPGKIYIAPGSLHMIFEESNGKLVIRLDNGPEENFCKPAVDPMLRSLINIYGNKILCVILTGMGHDGLKGAQMLADEGGRIIAQDEKTSVVWGMPGAVATAGICSAVLPVEEIGKSVRNAFHLY